MGAGGVPTSWLKMRRMLSPLVGEVARARWYALCHRFIAVSFGLFIEGV